MHSLNILFNADAQAKEAILTWAKKKNFTNPAFIVEDNSDLKSTDFPYPIFFLQDLISFSSNEEEQIYRCCHHYRTFFARKFPIFFKEINLITDELRNYNFELPMKYFMAYLKATQSSFKEIIIVISSPFVHFRVLFQGLIHMIERNSYGQLDDFLMFNQKSADFEKAHINFYQYYAKRIWKPRKLFQSLKALKKIIVFFCRKRFKPSIKQNIFSKSPEPCIFYTSSNPLYRNNFIPLYITLHQKAQKHPFLIATSKNIESAAVDDKVEYISLRKEIFKLICSPLAFMQISKAMLYWIIIKHLYLWKLKFFHTKNLHTMFLYYQFKIFLSTYGLILRLVQSALQTYYMDQVFKTNKPSVVYKDVSCSSHDARIGSLAQKHQIPVVTSVVASITSKYRSYGTYPCDFITLLGENQIPVFRKRGFDSSQLICVGQPELDSVKSSWNLKNSAAYLASIIPTYKPQMKTILIATGYIDLPNELKWIKALCEYAYHSDGSIQILLKPHPTMHTFYEVFRNNAQLILLPPDTILYPCLITADLVLTDVSHAGKLAIFFRKPLVVVNFSDKKYPFNNFDEEGVAWIAHNTHELENIIEDVCSGLKSIKDSAYDDYIQQHFTKDDGKASERIADFLLSF